MPATPEPPARLVFPNWFAVTGDPGAGHWAHPLDWDDPNAVQRLIEGLASEIDHRWEGRTEDFTRFAATVIADLCPLEGRIQPILVVDVIAFIRFVVTSAAVRHATICGRSSLIYNWLLCSLSDRPYVDIEPGVPIEHTFWQDRPERFLSSPMPPVQGYAPIPIAQWFADLYYAAWKYSLHHGIAATMLHDSRRIIGYMIEHGPFELKAVALEAAAQLAGWLNQTGEPEVADIAALLARAFDFPGMPAEARRVAGMSLATLIGSHTKQGHAHWAARVLAECRPQLVQHEVVHMLAASSATPDELFARYGELLMEVERFAERTLDDFGSDLAAITFRRSQLFDVIAPPVRTLLDIGRAREAVQLVAAWFGVPPTLRRRSPVLGVVPGHSQGVLYSVDGHAKLFHRDTDAAMEQLIAAVNHAYDLSIVLRHKRTSPRVKAGHWGRERGYTDDLAAATEEFYAFDKLSEFLQEAPIAPTAAFHPHAEHTPFQALSEKVLGTTWPTVTSFREPCPDRPLRRVLVWSCGTLLGGYEVRTVNAFFSARGVECVLLAEEGLTRERFLDLYHDDSFDAVWLQAHGMYDSREPHRAYIKLSVDGENTVSVSDMLQHPVRGEGRRLLMLNLCLGGTVLVSSAPACLGMGAMLAGEAQAVIGHLTEVGSFVAPLFGALTAVGLHQTKAFFPAFLFALRAMRDDRDDAIANLSTYGPEWGDLVERLGRSPPGVNVDDIRTWGTPVFYE